jgi:hypothetical protein
MTTGSPHDHRPRECHRARRHKIRPLTLAEHAVLAAISAHPKHRAGAFVSAPDGARRVAYRLTRAGYRRAEALAAIGRDDLANRAGPVI